MFISLSYRQERFVTCVKGDREDCSDFIKYSEKAMRDTSSHGASRSIRSQSPGSYKPPPPSVQEFEMTLSQSKGPSMVYSRDDVPPERVFVADETRDDSAQEFPTWKSSLTESSREAESTTDGSGDASVYHLSVYEDDGRRPTMDPDLKLPSPKHRQKLNEWYRKRSMKSFSRPIIGGSSQSARLLSPIRTDRPFAYSDKVVLSPDNTTMFSDDETATYLETLGSDGIRGIDTRTSDACEGDLLRTKIEVPWGSIAIMSIQLLVLITQLAMCGVARLEVNPMVGPYPDAFSEWGGKNAYLMLQENEWWRLITASFLHVGVLHLLVNAICIFWIISFFELEWGSTRWLMIFFLSSIGCTIAACDGEADTIGVASSGALMGLFSAKLAQVLSHTVFTVRKEVNDALRFDQLVGVFFGIAIQAILSSVTFIDGWGHVGGISTGFFCGIVLFCRPIISCCARFFWALIGLLGFCTSLTAAFYYFLVYVDPTEDIADACTYFRSLYPEGYSCECAW